MPKNKSNFNYSIIETKDISNGGARRLAVKVVLNEEYIKEQIKEIILEINNSFKKYEYNSFINVNLNRSKTDIICLYIAESEKKLDEGDLICRTLYIKKGLDKRYSGLSIKANDKINNIDIMWISI